MEYFPYFGFKLLHKQILPSVFANGQMGNT